MDRETCEKELSVFVQQVINFIQETDVNFTCTYIFDWSPTRSFSRGGIYKNGPGISLALYHMYPKELPAYFWEYKSFDKDQYIGGFYYGLKDPLLGIKALICHEVAHAVMGYKKLSVTSHGLEWKTVYRILRNKFINPFTFINVNKKVNFEVESLEAVLSKFVEQNENSFNANCHKFGLKKEHFGNIFIHKKEKYKICGINTRARKYSINVIRITDNKKFRFEHELVLSGLKKNT